MFMYEYKIMNLQFIASSASESVESSALSLQSVDDVHGGDGLSLGVLGVGDRISDHVLQEHFENTSRLFVDQAGDTLDSATSCQTSNGRLRYALDVVTQDFSVSLGATFAQSFASFSSS